MAELMLVNPRARRRRKTKARRKNPIHLRRAPSKHARKRRKPVHRYNAHRNPIRSHRRKRYSRNPISLKGALRETVMPAGIAALGAVGLDVIWGYIAPMLPMGLGDPTSMTGVLAKGAGAIGVGMIAGKMMGSKNGHLVALGGLTVVLHQLLKDKLSATFPTIAMGDVGDMGFYNPAPVGQGSLGYYPPAPVGMAGVGVYDSANIY